MFVFAHKNAARCMSEQNKKNILMIIDRKNIVIGCHWGEATILQPINNTTKN